MRETMYQLLQTLSLEVFEFEDQSHLHAGHAGAREGGHFALVLVSQAFEGKNRLARQRLVQDLLKPLFDDKKIHALSVIAKTPDEYFH